MAGAHGMLQEKVVIKNLDKEKDRRMCVLKGISDDLRYLTISHFLVAMQSSPACVL